MSKRVSEWGESDGIGRIGRIGRGRTTPGILLRQKHYGGQVANGRWQMADGKWQILDLRFEISKWVPVAGWDRAIGKKLTI